MKRFVIATIVLCVLAAAAVSGQFALAEPARASITSPARAAVTAPTGQTATPAPAVAGAGPNGETAPRAMGLVRATTGTYPEARRLATADRVASLAPSLDITNPALPVGNQGRQSSCVAWSTTYYYKTYQEVREHGWNASEADKRFSPAFVYNQINDGVDRGATFPDAFNCLVDNGAVDLNAMPYNPYDYTTQPTPQQRDAAKPYRAQGYAAIWRGAGGKDVNEIKAHLAAGDPVALGIPVYQAFYFCQGNWVDSPAAGEAFYGNHAILAVGYDDSAGGGQGGIKIVNSWGSSWGAGGYTYLSYRFVSSYCWEAWTMTDRESAPVISGISPDSGASGTVVTISGDNFGTCRGASAVKFGATQAAISGWDNNTILTTVPAGVSVCTVTVTNWLGEASNGKSFDVGLSLMGTTPGAAKPGATVTLYGHDLGDSGTLTYNGSALRVVSWSDSKVIFTAPDTNGTGTLKAYVDGKASNGLPFSVYSSIWYLAEGCTGAGFETWVLVQNPNSSPAHVNVTYMTPEGTVQGPQTVIPANSRQTYNVSDMAPGRWQVSTRVTADLPVYVERSMYGGGRAWGSESIGVETPGTTWYLAEGSTGAGFETWVLVQNPNGSAARVSLTYMTENGRIPGPTVTVAPNSRQSFNVADTANGVSGISTRVDSDQPVIAERSVYWSNRKGAHDSRGVTEPATCWYLAEGCTGAGFETWVPVMNPGSRDAKVTLTYMTERGRIQGPTVTIKANSRKAFHVADTVPNTWSVSTKVTSDQPVVVERSVYWSNRLEGHNSEGVTEPSETWYLPEGCTGPGFETWVLVQNPNATAAKVSLTYMTPGGERTGPSLTLPANSRKTFFVSDTVPDQWQVSTRVTADVPVIAERSMYGAGRVWGHDSVGISK